MKKYLNIIIPLIIGLVISISVFVWLRLDTNLPHWDMARHLYNEIQYRDFYREVLAGRRGILDLFGFYTYYPPLLYCVALLFNFLFGFSPDISVYSNIVWIFILIFSTYDLTYTIWKNQKAATVAVLVIMSMPIIIGQVREFQIDLPLTAFFAFSLWMIEKTKFFSNSKWSAWFGVVFGLGMLLKWTYLGYVLPASLLFFVIGYLKNKEDRKLLTKNFFIVLLIAFCVCGFWYLRNIVCLKQDFYSFGFKAAKLEGDPIGFTKSAYLYYADGLFKNYLYLPLTILLIISILNIFVFSKTVLLQKIWPYLVLLVIYYFIFSTLYNKDIRYIMPVSIILALVIASLLVNIKNKALIYLLLLLFLVIFIANNITVSFSSYLGTNYRPKNIFARTSFSQYGVIFSDSGGYTSASPRRSICPLQELVDDIPTGASARLIGDDEMYVSNWDTAYFLALQGKKWSDFDQPLINSDYLISKDGPVYPNSIATSKLTSDVDILKTASCIDGYRIYLLKVKK